jgi:hypothetical protein
MRMVGSSSPPANNFSVHYSQPIAALRKVTAKIFIFENETFCDQAQALEFPVIPVESLLATERLSGIDIAPPLKRQDFD